MLDHVEATINLAQKVSAPKGIFQYLKNENFFIKYRHLHKPTNLLEALIFPNRTNLNNKLDVSMRSSNIRNLEHRPSHSD